MYFFAEARPTVSPFFRLPPPGKVLLHIHDKHRLAPAALTYGGTKNEQTYIALDRAICSCPATEKKYTVQREKHIVAKSICRFRTIRYTANN